MAKRHLNRRQSWRIKKIQDERAKRANQQQDKFQQDLASGELGPEQQGLIIAHYGTQLAIEPINQPGNEFRCHLRANLPALVTGDFVVWRAGADNTGVVVAGLDRHNLLSRPDSRQQLKPVAANIDYIVIVIAPIPEPHANLIDRYLVAAEIEGIEPVLLFNKTDLLNDSNQEAFSQLLSTYQQLGYRVLQASTHRAHGLDNLQSLLDQHTSVFVGQSGVGKSSLVNALLPNVDTRVGALSKLSGKGTHTTTSAKLFHFPTGGKLIDSPGIREFALWPMSKMELAEGFRELKPLIGHCKFRDCQHEQEPGCAFLQAKADGLISATRFTSFEHIANSFTESG